MTREQAIEKFAHTRLHMFGERTASAWIEMFEALGIIKLDTAMDAEEMKKIIELGA